MEEMKHIVYIDEPSKLKVGCPFCGKNRSLEKLVPRRGQKIKEKGKNLTHQQMGYYCPCGKNGRAMVLHNAIGGELVIPYGAYVKLVSDNKKNGD